MVKFLLGVKKMVSKRKFRMTEGIISVTFDVYKNLINDKSFIAKLTPKRSNHNENSIESKNKIKKLEILQVYVETWSKNYNDLVPNNMLFLK